MIEKNCALLRYKNEEANNGAKELTSENIEFTYVPKTPISDITTETAWMYKAIAKFFILPKYSAFDFRDEIPNEIIGNKKVLNYIKKSLSDLEKCIREKDYILFEEKNSFNG